jgi:hypothetical protein
MSHHTYSSTAADMAKDTPIAGVAAAVFLGFGLSDWVLILGLVYGVARLLMFLVETHWKFKDRRANGKSK